MAFGAFPEHVETEATDLVGMRSQEFLISIAGKQAWSIPMPAVEIEKMGEDFIDLTFGLRRQVVYREQYPQKPAPCSASFEL